MSPLAFFIYGTDMCAGVGAWQKLYPRDSCGYARAWGLVQVRTVLGRNFAQETGMDTGVKQSNTYGKCKSMILIAIEFRHVQMISGRFLRK